MGTRSGTSLWRGRSSVPTTTVAQRPRATELEDDARPAKTLRKRLRREPQPILLIDEIVHLREADPQAFAWLRAIGQGEVGVLLAGSAWDWTRVVDRANEAPGSLVRQRCHADRPGTDRRARRQGLPGQRWRG